MRHVKTVLVGLAAAMLLVPGAIADPIDINQVGALLVYPMIVATPMGGPGGPMAGVETFVTITNTYPENLIAHVSYINGDDNSNQYCYECDFSIPLTGYDTETLVITNSGTGTYIWAEDSALDLSCPWMWGMLVVSLEAIDPISNTPVTVTDNVLVGEEVVVSYAQGAAFSIPAIPFSGHIGDGDRNYGIGTEYSHLPRTVAVDYLAPHINGSGNAFLSLFTLAFRRQFPPLVDCSVTGYDANENAVSASFQFGCWTFFDVCEISPEYCYPNLGLFNNDPHHPLSDTHGWLMFACNVDPDFTGPEPPLQGQGGVHGAIVQNQLTGSVMAAGSGTPFQSTASWGRLLYQSATTGPVLSLILEAAPGGGLD